MKIRLALKGEQDKAVKGATGYAKAIAAGDEDVAKDDDILEEAKTAFLLHRACRDFEHPENFSAFPSPRWMIDNLGSDELATLLNCYNTALAQVHPHGLDTSDATVEHYVAMCAAMSDTDVPDIALMQLPREYLIFLLVRMAEKIDEARRSELDAALQELEETEEEIEEVDVPD